MKRKHNTQPCSKCPFRRVALPGWLGDDTPEGFAMATTMDFPMPCHTSINYAKPDWKAKWDAGKIGKLCAGALIFTANRAALSRDPDRPRLLPDHETVFSTTPQFIEHHNTPLDEWIKRKLAPKSKP